MFQWVAKLFEEKQEVPSAWLTRELSKPKTHVIIALKSGQEVDTGPCNPYEIQGDFGFQLSSADRAARYVEACYRRGFFQDEKGVTYPIHNVNKTWLEVK